MDTMDKQELISALADGQLRGEAFAQAVQAAAVDPAAREAWHAYHLIGDALRSSDLAGGHAPQPFLEKLQERLREEPAPLASLRQAVEAGPPAAAGPQVIVTREPAANDSNIRWKMAAGLASVAAVAAIGWNLAGGSAPAQQPVASSAPSAPLVVRAGDRGPMVRDPHLDQLLAAHRQLAGAPALQGAGFLRNATFEGPAR